MYAMVIGGQAVSAVRTFPVINPATEEVCGHAPDCSREQLESAIAAAEAALPAWRADAEKRRQVLLDCAEKLRAHADELASVLTMEQGKPTARAVNEIMGSAAWLSYTASLELPVEVIKDDETALVEVHRKSIGVVGAITPWNYPVMMAVWKFAPAILAGNTVVLKSSPYTPLATLLMAQLLNDVIPPGVVNFLSGGDELGKWISGHPRIRKVTFTGSTAAGRHVAKAAAPDLKRLTLELGGNDPAIVFPSVDPRTVAQKIYTASFENCGQVCVAIKRAYVHEAIFDAVVNELVKLAGDAVVGDGSDPVTTMGPLNNRAQLERVVDLASSAREAGGKFLTGGERLPGVGYFYPPTIVTGLQDTHPLVVEEQFGPILPVIPFHDTQEVIERVNQGHFGLAASVWSVDIAEARRVAAAVEAGTVWINPHLAMMPQAPIAGVKWSGLGVENGRWGLESYTELQTISIAKM